MFGIDETLERRQGPQISALGVYRDAVRSSRSCVVKASGLRWVSLMWLGRIPWAGRYWALPVLTALAPSERYYQRRGRSHKKLTDRARQMILQLRRWLPHRSLVLVGDSGYAVLDLLHFCQSLREPVTLITRLRLGSPGYGWAHQVTAGLTRLRLGSPGYRLRLGSPGYGWAHQVTTGLTRLRLGSPGYDWAHQVTDWAHQVTAGLTRLRLGSPGYDWAHQVTAGLTRLRLGSPGYDWAHQVTAGLTRLRLGSPGYGWAHQVTAGLTRLRLDAGLYALAPPRLPGQNGRPRVKGVRLPTLKEQLGKEQLGLPAVSWNVAPVAWYDGTVRTVELASQTALWYHSGKPPVPIR